MRILQSWTSLEEDKWAFVIIIIWAPLTDTFSTEQYSSTTQQRLSGKNWIFYSCIALEKKVFAVCLKWIDKVSALHLLWLQVLHKTDGTRSKWRLQCFWVFFCNSVMVLLYVSGLIACSANDVKEYQSFLIVENRAHNVAFDALLFVWRLVKTKICAKISNIWSVELGHPVAAKCALPSSGASTWAVKRSTHPSGYFFESSLCSYLLTY